MTSDWPTVRLGDLTSKITKGTTPKAFVSNSAAGRINFIKVETISPDGRFIPSKFASIDAETNTSLARSILQEDDLLFTIAGTIGRVARVRKQHLPANTNQAVAIVRADPQRVDIGYLSCVLGDRVRVQQAQSRVVQSVQANFSLGELADLEIPLPPLAEQRRIAGVLGALDDLTEVNRGLIADLDALRQAASASLLAHARESVPLSSVARFVNGKNFTKDASGSGRPVIRTPELRQGPNGGTVWNDVEATSDFIAQAGDMLFVWSGSLMIDRWIHEEGLVNQHIFKVIPQPGIPDWLVYSQIEHQMPWFLGLAADKATTMGHIQRGHLDADVPMPSTDALAEAAAGIAPLWDAQLQLSLENKELARTRDELLPLLMSGRVRVAEAVAA